MDNPYERDLDRNAANHQPLTPLVYLERAARTYPDHIAIIHGGQRISYRDFWRRSLKLAAALASRGIGKGDTVTVMLSNTPPMLEAHFGVPMTKAVLHSLNTRLDAAVIAFQLDHAGTKLLIVDREFSSVVKEALALARVKPLVIDYDDPDYAADAPYPKGERIGAVDYEEFVSGGDGTFAWSMPDDEWDAISLNYTSGTTGNPKGVCFTHRQLVLHTLACNAPFGAADGTGFAYKDVYMPLTPMFHVHAWGVPYVATMLGMTQVYPGRYEPEMLCRLHAQHKVTYSHCVPTILRMLLDAAEKTGTDVSGWTITVGGSALSPQLCAEGRRKGMRLIAGYGMSETGPLVSVARIRPGTEGDDAAEIQALTATVPAPLISARIVDDDMNDLPHDGQTRGELVLRAPWLTPCYTGDAKASETLWHGGWMHTQDIATIDPDGYIRIRDRLKDVIKTGGEWIDSIQLEELVATAEGVVEVAVVAMPDAKWGERPLAVVVVRPGAALTLETLNAPIEAAISQGTITRYAKLERFAVVEGLPRTSVGKIDKKLIRATHADNAQAGVA